MNECKSETGTLYNTAYMTQSHKALEETIVCLVKVTFSGGH